MKLIDLLTASRKNENIRSGKQPILFSLFILSLLFIGISGVLFQKHGIMPSRENVSFQIAGGALVIGTFLLFYSLSTVLIQAAKAQKGFYLKGLNTFLVSQIGSKLQTNYFIMAIICILLTVTIGTVSIGASTALTMNELAKAATPYDLNILSDVEIDGDGSIEDYLVSCDIQMANYAEKMEQISIYESDITYADLFKGQDINLWKIDENIPIWRCRLYLFQILTVCWLCREKPPLF